MNNAQCTWMERVPMTSSVNNKLIIKKRRGLFVLGLTGGFGSGKSTVAGMFKKLHVPVIDADALAHGVIAPGTVGFKQVVRYFSKGVLNNDGHIDRKFLADIVFKHVRARKKLEGIVHPAVVAGVNTAIKKLPKSVRLVVVEVPLLYETGLNRSVDAVVVVWVPGTVQRERLVRSGRFSASDVSRRMRSQMPLSEKKKRADHVINNACSKKEVGLRAQRFIQKLQRQLFLKKA